MHRSTAGDWRISALVTPAALDTARETREGWALLTVETEVNGDSGHRCDTVKHHRIL
jgi:hypothetical protein